MKRLTEHAHVHTHTHTQHVHIHGMVSGVSVRFLKFQFSEHRDNSHYVSLLTVNVLYCLSVFIIMFIYTVVTISGIVTVILASNKILMT